MGKLVVTEFVSLDGIFEDPGGAEGYKHGGWTFAFDHGEGMQFKFDELMAAEVQLLGRVTYEGFAKAWPAITDEAGFAEKMNGMPKVVVSTTLHDPSWNNTTVIAEAVAERVRELKQRVEGDVLVAGSGKLAGYLLNNDLVDEVRLMIFPVVLGEGRRLFEGADRITLKLTEMRRLSDDGVMLARYVPAEVPAHA